VRGDAVVPDHFHPARPPVRSTLSFTWNDAAPRAEPFGVPLALLCGLLMGFAHIPFSLSALVALPLAGLLYLSAREGTPRLAARVAFWGWLGFWSVHLFWLPQSFAPSFGPAVWFLMPLVWIIEAGFNALLTWIAYRVTNTPVGFLGAMAGGLVILEWTRGLGPLAFPWGNFGYALVGTPLAQISSLGGVYLGSLLLTLLAASLAGLAWFQWRWLLVTGLLALSGLAYGLLRPAPPPPTQQAWLLQGNIDPFKKFVGTDDLSVYRSLLKGVPKTAVVVLPEAALDLPAVAKIPQFTGGQPLPANQRLPDLPKLLAGVSDYRQGARLNSVAAISNSRLLEKTDKTHLVPFGEYSILRRELSLVYELVYRAMNLPNLGNADPSREQRVLELGGERFGAFVCYDSIFPDLPRSLVQRGAQVLVEPTNDGWFGGGRGNEQHFAMDRLRAIETGRYLLRVANTGITAGVDPLGRVLNHLPQNRLGALLTRYAPLEGWTPYVRLGDWPLWLAALVALGFTLTSRNTTRW
jgi:apolipoprotein N-acyltransferase